MSDTLLTTRDAAAYLSLSPKSLERYRCEGTGPQYIKLGTGRRASVRYRKADLEAWVTSSITNSTTAHQRGVQS